MSARFAIAGLALLLAACRVGEVAPTPTTPGPTRTPKSEPLVRVGLKIDTTAVFVSTSTASEIADRNGNVLARPAGNDTWTFTADATSITGTSQNTRETIRTDAVPLTVRVREQSFVKVGDKTYRGDVILRLAGPGRISAINVLEMEQYLLGVVPFEIGRLPAAQIEAIKAQAIAARTYAVGGMGSRDALGFDFYATVADQVYGGTSGEDSIVSRAVRETRGEIIAHNKQPIIAYYSSTCGGHTADVNESWPWRPPQPYLKGRPDTDPNGEAFCKTSNRYRWNVGWSGDSLRTILQQTMRTRLGDPNFTIRRLEDVRVTGNSKSGRAEAIAITADGATHRVPADSIRWVLRPTATGSLNSSLILDMKVTKTAGGLGRLDVHGSGWGHGVGMCQVGAMGRARAGQSYRQILTAYYTDVEILRLY